MGKEINEQGGVAETDVPWIRIHDRLYASVTKTGDMSYQPLIRNLYKNAGLRKFVILSGRHGGPLNIVNAGIFERRQLDTVATENNKKLFPLAEIELVDTARMGGVDSTVDHIKKLKQFVSEKLGEGYVVILAWCYSLYAFHPEIDEIVKTIKTEAELLKRQAAATEEPVCDIVKTYFADFAFAAARRRLIEEGLLNRSYLHSAEQVLRRRRLMLNADATVEL